MRTASVVLIVVLADLSLPSGALAQVKPPLEASANLSGPDALSAHVGNLGFFSGFGLTYRHLGPPKSGDTDSFLAAYSPLSFVTAGGGVEYVRLTRAHSYLLGSVGLALRPVSPLSVSFAYHPFRGLGALTGARLSTWDVGVGLRPARWLALSAAIQSLNAPEWNGLGIPRTYAFSLGLRPFLTEVVTLGAEAWMVEDQRPSLWPLPRIQLDVRPVPWLGLMAASSVRGDVFFGVSLRERHVEAGFGMGVSRSRGLEGSYTYARLQSQAREGLSFSGKKTVQLGLGGDLRPDDGWAILRMGKPGFGEIPLELAALAERKDVCCVRLVMQGPSVGLATAHEIRDAIAGLRARGKKVTVALGDADDLDLFIASAADEIVAEPQGSIHLDGIKVTLRYFKHALDKLGARVEVQASGPFKNSPDAYTRADPTPAQLEAQNAILDDYYSALVEAISQGRKLPKERVEALMGQAVFTGQQAKDAGLVDVLSWPSDPAAAPPGSRDAALEHAGRKTRSTLWSGPPAIGLIHITGTIVGGDSFEDPFGLGWFDMAGADDIVRALEAARTDSDLKAVVVRIDSPGGDILASDFIWQAMRRLKGTKPLVVSMGDVAASGGYYAALPADVIFAQPETVTGSIGVFSLKADLSGLYDKLGITHHVLTRGPHADMYDTTRGLSDEEHKLLAKHVDDLYRDFVRKVAVARGLSEAKVDELARGRVWTGAAAKERGLVDRLGGLVAAVGEAKRRAGYAETAVMDIRPVPGKGSGLGLYAAEVKAGLGVRPGLDLGTVETLARSVVKAARLFDGRALYLFPYSVEID